MNHHMISAGQNDKKFLILVDDRPGLTSTRQQEEVAVAGVGAGCYETIFLISDQIANESVLINEATKRGATHIVIPRLQVIRAIAKKPIELIRLIADLSHHGIQFRCAQEAISTEDGLGIFLGDLARAWEEAVASYKHENPRVSQIRAKEKGVPLGRPKKRDDEMIAAMRREGASFREIAAKAGVSVAAVQRSLQPAKTGPKS